MMKSSVIANYKMLAIHRFTKNINNKVEQTLLYTLTFQTSTLPEYIKFGYQRIPIRPHVPLPTRCMKCFKFGHISTYCTSKKLCSNCSEDFHTDENSPLSKCENTGKCINCLGEHSSLNRTCPIFVKEKEIQKIKIFEK